MWVLHITDPYGGGEDWGLYGPFKTLAQAGEMRNKIERQYNLFQIEIKKVKLISEVEDLEKEK